MFDNLFITVYEKGVCRRYGADVLKKISYTRLLKYKKITGLVPSGIAMQASAKAAKIKIDIYESISASKTESSENYIKKQLW